MRFVPIKTVEQQGEAVTHKARQLLIKQRTMAMNALRGLMAEFGVIVPQGPQHIGKLLAILADPDDTSIAVAHTALNTMRETLAVLETQIDALEAEIKRQARANPSRPASGHHSWLWLILSGACAAIVTEPKHYDSGRDFAASLGVVPRQDSTGGKTKLGPISKRGNGYLRRLLVNGAMAVLTGKNARNDPWRAEAA